jgi:hypothetical protein
VLCTAMIFTEHMSRSAEWSHADACACQSTMQAGVKLLPCGPDPWTCCRRDHMPYGSACRDHLQEEIGDRYTPERPTTPTL